MICALCKKDRKLTNSHIIPEFLYKCFYDEKHSFTTVSFETVVKERLEYKGITEKLLCVECENKFSKYETYVSNIFNGTIRIKSMPIAVDIIELGGLNYKKFKLFGLSILWRSSVSNHRYFSNVDLGSDHQEELRQLLFNGDPGPQLKYGFSLIRLRDPKLNPRTFLMILKSERIFTRNSYRFVLGGFIWTFIVSKQGVPEQFSRLFINEEGKMIMGVVESGKVGLISAVVSDIKSQLSKAPKSPFSA